LLKKVKIYGSLRQSDPGFLNPGTGVPDSSYDCLNK